MERSCKCVREAEPDRTKPAPRSPYPIRQRSTRTLVINCSELYWYSPVPNKRPGRLIFSNIFAFGTVIETGTLIFFPTFLESSTIIMVLSALVRLLGFEDCACETGRPRELRAVALKGKIARKIDRIISSLAYKFNPLALRDKSRRATRHQPRTRSRLPMDVQISCKCRCSDTALRIQLQCRSR